MQMDACFEQIAAGGHDRLLRSQSSIYPEPLR
jgi:hypothetical protein